MAFCPSGIGLPAHLFLLCFAESFWKATVYTILVALALYVSINERYALVSCDSCLCAFFLAFPDCLAVALA